MKHPDEVGRDFDDYAARWKPEAYRMEVGYEAGGVIKADSDKVKRPGDEWGDQDGLRATYRWFIDSHLPGTDHVNVLEIGPGAGRSTEVIVELLGDRIDDYHVVDVSPGLTAGLQERVGRPVAVHIVDDIDLSELPDRHFDVCIAQSCWSHVSMYDQFRYLRDLRRVLKPGAPLFVYGIFLLGVGDDWTWNRFRRRVDQIDRRATGVYHEFTGVMATVEMLCRLGWDVASMHARGFVARCEQNDDQANVAEWKGPLPVRYSPAPEVPTVTGHFPPQPAGGRPAEASVREALRVLRVRGPAVGRRWVGQHLRRLRGRKR